MVVGNGYIAAMTHSEIMNIAGVFSGDFDQGHEPVRASIPSFWDGYTITGSEGDYAAALDIGRSAVFAIARMSGGGFLRTRRYAHRALPHLIAIDFTLDNAGGTRDLVANISQPEAWGSSQPAVNTPDTSWDFDAGSGSAEGKMACWTGRVRVAEDPSLGVVGLGLCGTDLRTQPLTIKAPAGGSATHSLIAAVFTTLDGSNPIDRAASAFRSAAAMTAAARWGLHETAVSKALASGIEVSGNNELAKLINASLHMLVASLRPEPEFWYSSSPGGLATNCYNGHTFWDMETWMYPNLLFFHPDLARGTIGYRVRGLGWAQKWAKATGRVGVRYPWQTAGIGKVASSANQAEIHIVGDVALSMWQYYAATRNDTWLESAGLPVLDGAAEFFAAWAEENTDGTFSLKNTQGPDEFHTGDDSCYVNAAAALALRYAANFSVKFGRPHPRNWTAVANGVRIPFDSKRQMHLEFEQWTDSMKCKQADTIMLGYPLGVDMPANVRKNDLDYYAAHTGNGPSMTWSVPYAFFTPFFLLDPLTPVQTPCLHRLQEYVPGRVS